MNDSVIFFKKVFSVATLSAIFLSAFLVFSLQPMLAKFILPWFGGNQSVWIVCMLFFQVGLLLGYAYANFAAKKLSSPIVVAVQLLLLLAALFFLPVVPDQWWKWETSLHPIVKVLGLLTVTAGLPYFALSATAPLAQAWWARLQLQKPYRLYALSNTASLLGLLSFPFFIELFFTSGQQARLWSFVFSAFVLCFAVASFAYWKLLVSAPIDQTLKLDNSAEPAKAGDFFLWTGYAALGSLLLLSLSNAITEDVATVPLLWVVPFAIYLLTFILNFHDNRWYRPKSDAYVFLFVLLSWLAIANFDFSVDLVTRIVIYSLLLFTGCMLCHGELVRIKPGAESLTAFYLAMALGGAVGGVFVGVVAPLVFNSTWEFPITLSLVVILAYLIIWRQEKQFAETQLSFKLKIALWLSPLVILFIFLVGSLQFLRWTYAERNFYGTLKVLTNFFGQENESRALINRRINHGSQFTAAGKRGIPTTYYGKSSGIGLMIESLAKAGHLRIGVIGLGAGTLTAYAGQGDYIRYYELDPADVEIAQKYFTYLSDSQAEKDIVIGDARVSLEREPSQNFDVLVIDAFSGDSIPTHLLTQEAMGVYLRHLRSNGVVAFHITNAHLNLQPVVAALVSSFKLSAILIESGMDLSQDIYPASWAMVSADQNVLNAPELVQARSSSAWQQDTVRDWTDDYSNLFNILK